MEEKKLIPKVFGWMFIGLLVTFLTGYVVSINENMLYNVANNFWIIALVELGLVILFSTLYHKVNYLTGVFLFITYSFVTGLTFSSIFIAYEMSSIITVFLVAALLFGSFALIGAKTNIDLSKFSTIFFMILLGGIIMSVINIFLGNEMFDIIISWILLITFFGITAYDMQTIKRLSYEIDDPKKITIMCAINLYLDFINIFLKLLNLFGKSED